MAPPDQIAGRPLPRALYGHGIVGKPKPRVTVTSHPDGRGTYVWYLGGNIAEESAKLTEPEALAFAKRAAGEFSPPSTGTTKNGQAGMVSARKRSTLKPHLPSKARACSSAVKFCSWPTKLTFVPALAGENVLPSLKQSKITFRSRRRMRKRKCLTYP